MGDPMDLRRIKSQFDEAPHAFVDINPLMNMHFYMINSSDHQTYVEEKGNPFYDKSMEEEYNSLIKNQSSDLHLLPFDHKLVCCKWVYRTKK